MFFWYLAPIWLITLQIYKAAQVCDEFTDLDFHHAFIGTSLNVRLLLYTRSNAGCGRLLSHSTLQPPLLNLTRPTTFIIHGYRPTGSPPKWLGDLRELLLARADMNVIVVDWNYGAANLNYIKVVENTHKTAENLTAFIRTMQEHGCSLHSIHMVGVSLGAHISGFVGAKLNGKIGRITALDAAGPQFTNRAKPENCLDPSDAEFVDVLHTDMDALGFRKPLGHIDFYANGGADQPGCPKTIFSGGAYFKCDHQRSVFLYLGSLNRTCAHRAFPCQSYADFLDGRCLGCQGFGAAGCPIFGYDIIRWKDTLLTLGQTKAFFTTNQESPFCRTNYRLDVVTWNQDVHWGYITIKLHGDGREAVATINHKASRFQKYTDTRLLAQFDTDLPSVQKVSITFSSGNALKPRYKLRVLRLRLQHLEREDRPLCRYDVLLEENKEVTFRPIPCEESNF